MSTEPSAARLAEILPVAVILVDADGSVRSVNPTAAEQIGVPAGDLMGQRLGDLVGGRPESFAAFFRACLGSRQPVTGALPLARRDGQVVIHRCDGVLLGRGEGGDDLVALRLVPRHEGRDGAEDGGDRDRLLATLSHELRTPLTPILAWTWLLRNRWEDPSVIERGLDGIERAVQAETKLIEKLLDRRRSHARTIPGASRGPEPMSTADLGGVRVLVVDDDPDILAGVAAILTAAGAEVRTAGSSAAALQVVQEWHPGLLVADIGMPEEDGYALVGKMRQLAPEQGGQTPAVALTAYARAEDRQRALGAGFQGHLAKPVEPSKLVAVAATLSAPDDTR